MARKLTALLVCFVFVFAAGCTQLKQMTMKRQEAQAMAHEATLEEAIMLLGHMEAVLLEGIEEAMAYVLLKEIEEKEDHYLMMREFDRLVDVFKIAVDLARPEHKGLSAPFNSILKAKVELEAAAYGMFDPLEAGRKLCKSQIIRFERGVDRVTRRYDSFMRKFLKRHYKEDLIEDKDTLAAIKLSLMHSDFIEGVEELFGFFLLKQADERNEFFAKMEDFDRQAAAFKELEYLAAPGNRSILRAFDKMMESKEAYEAEARVLIEAFGKTWKADVDGIRALEEKIDAFTAAYDSLLKEFDYLRIVYRGRG